MIDSRCLIDFCDAIHFFILVHIPQRYRVTIELHLNVVGNKVDTRSVSCVGGEVSPNVDFAA